MLCKKCFKEIPSNMPFCIYCGEEQSIEADSQDIETVTEISDNKINKIDFTSLFNKIKMLSKRNKIIILIALLIVIFSCVIASIIGNENKLEGKWENGEIGYIIFTENGHLFVDNDNISGTYEVDGSTIIFYRDTGKVSFWEFEISNDTLILTYEDGSTMGLYRAK